MKENGIRIRFGEDYVSVQRRPVSIRRNYAAGLCMLAFTLFLAYRQFPVMLLAFQQRRFGVSLICLYLVAGLPILICFGLIRGIVAEVLRIDRENVRIASKRPIGRWTREKISSSTISDFKFGIVQQSRYGSKNGLLLEFPAGKRRVMAGLNATQANDILRKSAALGLDVLIDPAMGMLVDVEQRGLFGK